MDDYQNNDKLSQLSSKIGYEFANVELLKQALTHRSFVNESKYEEVSHNERLEFLGDAVLELVVTEYLFNNYTDRPEGELTSFRAAVVRTESLADTANSLGLGEFIFMSKGEAATGGRSRPYILANTVEALLGAIYLDGGFPPCKLFIEKHLTVKLKDIVENRLDIDAKSHLQELSQEKFKFTPIYKTVKEEGPDHERTFTIEVIVNDESYGQGQGRSKQEAEQAAARIALSRFNKYLV